MNPNQNYDADGGDQFILPAFPWWDPFVLDNGPSNSASVILEDWKSMFCTSKNEKEVV